MEASATIVRGEKVGLVGPNGAGKTTVFRLINGEEETDGGQVSVERGVTVGYFSQDVGEMSGITVLAAVLDGAGPVSSCLAELKEIEDALADPDRADEMEALCDRLGEVQTLFDSLGGYGLEAIAKDILYGLGFSADVIDGDVGNLSGGWKMRVALAKILLQKPSLMMLDEPSLGLSPILVSQLFKLIKDLNLEGLTMILVEQNTNMALATAMRGYVLELGAVVLSGPSSELASDSRLEEAYLGGLDKSNIRQ